MPKGHQGGTDGGPGSGARIISMNDSLSGQAIREQLTKLLSSQIFARSERLSRFLRFTVGHVLAGKQTELKEYVIGVEVYDRRSPYHPSVDSIVRSEARRLRAKLKQYYEFDGKSDPVKIFFRLGSYVPVICAQEHQVNSASQVAELAVLRANTAGDVVISLDRFASLASASQATACARGVTSELLHLLMGIKGCRVVAPTSNSFHPVPFHLHLQGDIRQYKGSLRITCRLISGEGFHLASHRFDVSAKATGSFRSQEEIAAAVVSRITPIVRAITVGCCHPLPPKGRVISIAVPQKRKGIALASS
jgi:TolB-like protein